MTPNRLARAAASRAGRREPASVEPLEPRRLLTVPYGLRSFDEFFGFDLERQIAPPADFDPSLGAGVAEFGRAAGGLGDIDGDGRDDFAIAATGRAAADGSTEISGKVFVYSGADGTLIRTLGDGVADFGFALANVGDINDDGVNDLLVGSPRFDADADGAINRHGRASVFSGADGSIIHTFTGTGDADELGFAVTGIGDQNGDGVPDIVVGAPGAGGAGEVNLYSGADGSVIRTLAGDTSGDRFGHVVAALGDIPSDPMDLASTDGVDELLVSAPGTNLDTDITVAGWDRAGRVFVFDGATADVRWSRTGFVHPTLGLGDGFGVAAAVVGSGASASIVVGEPGKDGTNPRTVETDVGQVLVFDAFGRQINLLDGQNTAGGFRFGVRISAVGDITGDGRAEVIILGEEGLNPSFQLYSIPDLISFQVPAENRPLIGTTLAGVGDVNGDGIADFISANSGAAAATLISSVKIVGVSGVLSANRSLSIVFSDILIRQRAHSRFAVIDGVYTPFRDIAGIGKDGGILAANDAGFIVGALIVDDPSDLFVPRYGELFVVRDGVRTFLTDAITSVVGADEVPTLRFVDLNEGGSILLRGTDSAWMYSDGVLTLLFAGVPIEMNDRGDVVGTLRRPDGSTVPVLRSADGSLTELSGLLSATSIANNGTIGGMIAGETVNVPVLLRNGTVTELQPSRLPDGFAPDTTTAWTFFGLDDEGRAVVSFRFSNEHFEFGEYYLLTGDGSLAPSRDAIFGRVAIPAIGFDATSGGGMGVGLSEGRFLTTNGFVGPLDPPLPWTADEGSAINPAPNGSGAIGFRGELGDILILTRADGQWSGAQMHLPGDQMPIDEVLTYVDPKNGETYAFVLTSGTVLWGRLREDRSATVSALTFSPPPSHIVDHATVFVSTDGRVHLAGTDHNGDLIIFYQNDSADPSAPANWSYNNLTTQHLASQGEAFEPVASDLTAYVAPWGASHIAYLDEVGNVHVVWWAPGTTFWTTTNLTEAADATPMQGRITSYVTPWGGLNVAGTDLDGNLVALWWVPGFGGQWRFDRLAGDEAAKLDPDTITSYVTPWGGLNIAGLDRDTSQVVAYWWTPATNVWTVEAIAILDIPDDFSLTGRLSSAVADGSVQNLFGRDPDGHVVRLFWELGDGSEWRYESVTDQLA